VNKLLSSSKVTRIIEVNVDIGTSREKQGNKKKEKSYIKIWKFDFNYLHLRPITIVFVTKQLKSMNL
jgi:hypothetical protein